MKILETNQAKSKKSLTVRFEENPGWELRFEQAFQRSYGNIFVKSKHLIPPTNSRSHES